MSNQNMELDGKTYFHKPKPDPRENVPPICLPTSIPSCDLNVESPGLDSMRTLESVLMESFGNVGLVDMLEVFREPGVNGRFIIVNKVNPHMSWYVDGNHLRLRP